MVRGTYRYQSHEEPWTELRMRIREIAQSRVRYGYRKIRVLLNREGWGVGKYLVYRLYKEEGLALKKRPQRKRKAVRHREERFIATAPNQAWSIDFVADQLQDGKRFRALTILDVYTREGVAIEAGQSLKGEDVVRVLNRVKQQRGVPKFLFCDNGSEFTSQAMDPMGLPEWNEDRLLAPGQADRQRLRGIVQRNLPSRVLECPRVRQSGRSKTADRAMAAGIQ
jgi:putative transposase